MNFSRPLLVRVLRCFVIGCCRELMRRVLFLHNVGGTEVLTPDERAAIKVAFSIMIERMFAHHLSFFLVCFGLVYAYLTIH